MEVLSDRCFQDWVVISNLQYATIENDVKYGMGSGDIHIVRDAFKDM